MSHSVKIYDTCIGCTQCVRACPTDVLEMIPWDGCKAKQIASAPRTEDCVGCKRCESACPTDFLSVRVYLWHETTRSMGLSYWYVIKNSTWIIRFLFTDKSPLLEKIYFLEQRAFWSINPYLVFITSYFPWLTILVVLPIFAGSSILFFPHRGNKVFRWYTICICLLELLLTTYVFCYHFQLDDTLVQLREDSKWIDIFDFHWRLGIDGLSIGPILLTGFITTLATLAAWPVTRNSQFFYFACSKDRFEIQCGTWKQKLELNDLLFYPVVLSYIRK